MSLSPLAEVSLVVFATAAVAWALTYLVHSTLLFAMAAALDRAALLSPRDRAALWRMVLLLPPLSAFLHIAGGGMAGVPSLDTRALAMLLGSRIGVAWLTVGAAALLVLAAPGAVIIGRVRLARTLGRRREPAAPEVELVRRICATTGQRLPRVMLSERLLSPAAVGLRGICLPRDLFDALPEDERRALVAHELGHLARRDPLWLAIASAVTCALAWQPLNRLSLSRLRQASEEAADDFAVVTTCDARALARALGALGMLVAAVGPSAFASGPRLVRRIEHLLGETPRRRPVSRRVARLALALLVAVALLAPGAGFSARVAADSIPWLTPSREAPNARMLEVRRFNRALRDRLRCRRAHIDVIFPSLEQHSFRQRR